MRLTNVMRKQFVDAVMKKVRVRHKFSEEQYQEAVKSISLNALPKEVAVAYKKYPEFIIMGKKWMTYDRGCINHYLHFFAGQDFNSLDISVPAAKYAKSWEEEEAKHSKMRERLESIAAAMTTTDKLKEALPELAKFVPFQETAKMYLPVSAAGIVKDLKELGLED